MEECRGGSAWSERPALALCPDSVSVKEKPHPLQYAADAQGSQGGTDYLGMVVNIHTVVGIDALCADNLTVSLQSLQLEKFSSRQKLKTIKRAHH